MFVRCLLVPTAAGIDATPRYQAALMLGRRLGAHIAVLYISPEPSRYLTTLPAVALANGVDLSALKKEFEFDAAAGKAALLAWCGSAGIVLTSTAGRLDATFATRTETQGEVEPILALAGRVNDLTIVDRPDPDIPFTNRAFDAAVFSTGRPALMLSKTLPPDLLSHVAIAWDGSLEAARTVGQATTLIHEADRVICIKASRMHAENDRFVIRGTVMEDVKAIKSEIFKVAIDLRACETSLETLRIYLESLLGDEPLGDIVIPVPQATSAVFQRKATPLTAFPNHAF